MFHPRILAERIGGESERSESPGCWKHFGDWGGWALGEGGKGLESNAWCPKNHGKTKGALDHLSKNLFFADKY